ncbi:hypothetical protein B0H19DRAFT_1272893 [Mycena capillaripes]|nr:hypothetical protein B0H19DRAFT_1272893 [Mycena capillaripes]
MSLIFALVATLISATFLAHAEAAVPTPDFIKISPAGQIAVIQLPQEGSDTRLYYQRSDSSIWAAAINGPFVVGSLSATQMRVPAGEAALGTPIVVVADGTTVFNEIRLYFVSPSNILSEYIFDLATGWRGGPTCTDCITTENFVVNPGNRVLYAMWNTAPTAQNPTTLRVGYIGAGSPDGLTEADWDSVHGWRLAVLN